MSLDQGKELQLNRSKELAARNEKLIAGFTQTMMKKPDQFAPGKFPMFLESGHGAVVRDVDGQEYVDYICGLGANSLGNAHPAIIKAITIAMEKGISHSLPTEYESEAAAALVDLVPQVEMVRFFKTGADANSAAIRLARYISRKEEIVTIGYNGWHDQLMFDTAGVPKALKELTHRMPLFTPMDENPLFDLLDRRADDLAAVLISIPYNRRLNSDFYQKLRDICRDKEIILIFDEVMSGFRIGRGGAQEFFAVEADLVTYSKALAAGMLRGFSGSHEREAPF